MVGESVWFPNCVRIINVTPLPLFMDIPFHRTLWTIRMYSISILKHSKMEFQKRSLFKCVWYLSILNLSPNSIQMLYFTGLKLAFVVTQYPKKVRAKGDYKLVLLNVKVEKWTPFRLPFEYWFAIQMPGTIVLSIWIANHLNNDQVKVCYSDVAAIQMFAIQIPPVFVKMKPRILVFISK